MITGVATVNLLVLNQDDAKHFYVDTLGFEERNDATMDGFRWLTVGPKNQKDIDFLLVEPAPPMFSPEDAGRAPGDAREGHDARRRARHRRLPARLRDLRAKGVTFLQEPADRPYGKEALFRDNSGNWFSLTQSKYDAAQPS